MKGHVSCVLGTLNIYLLLSVFITDVLMLSPNVNMVLNVSNIW